MPIRFMRSFYLYFLAILVLSGLFVTSQVTIIHAAPGVVPQITAGLGRQLDRQIAERLGQNAGEVHGVSLFMTTPVDLTDLEVSMPLARQIQEELAAWFTSAGYQVQEIRKGAGLLFEPSTGELILTRRPDVLSTTCPTASAVVAGTYTITPRSVRFNIRLMKTGTQEILAMSNMTIPLNSETAGLLSQDGEGRGVPIIPTVITQLP